MIFHRTHIRRTHPTARIPKRRSQILCCLFSLPIICIFVNVILGLLADSGEWDLSVIDNHHSKQPKEVCRWNSITRSNYTNTAIPIVERESFPKSIDGISTPFVVRNAIHSLESLDAFENTYTEMLQTMTRPLPLLSYRMLQTVTQPSRFMWYNIWSECANGYKRSTQWTSGTFQQWKLRKDWYLNDYCPSNIASTIVPDSIREVSLERVNYEYCIRALSLHCTGTAVIQY